MSVSVVLGVFNGGVGSDLLAFGGVSFDLNEHDSDGRTSDGLDCDGLASSGIPLYYNWFVSTGLAFAGLASDSNLLASAGFTFDSG